MAIVFVCEPFKQWVMEDNTVGGSATNDGFGLDNFGTAAVPEPATMVLFGVGLVGLAAFGRKRFLKR